MKHFAEYLTFLIAAGLLSVVVTVAQAQDQGPAEEAAADASAEGEEADAGEEADEAGIKPYEEIITEEAVTDSGVFDVHQIKNDFFYEIPAAEFGTEFLWVGRIAKTVAGQGFGGEKIDERVVRWERRNEQVFLRNVSYQLVADDDAPIAQAVRAANNDTILMAFDIKALGEDDSVVIDVTRLFASEIPEFSARSRIQARGFDDNRSYIDRVMSFPENIEVRAVHTYTRPPNNGTPEPGGGGNQGGMPPGSATLEIAFSMVRLPEEPMMPRLFDDRVGYFSVRQTDFGVDEHRAPERRYITRWRLQKQDPSAELSPPIEPIEFWIDPATPTQWVPYVRQGIEDWQVAFAEAGFIDGIVARDAPTADEDPEWSPEDARYSVIRWLPSDVENAMGPHVHDPRTGEILEADIQFHHNVQNLLRDWYFVQVAPLDPRAQSLPLPDELMGRLIRFVTAHEVGHSLGFQHNMKASSTYTLENVRDAEWVSEMGHTPTLMDYSRFNYVAQPGDNIAVEDLVPDIGPYDIWATAWGYTPIPEARTPDDESATLNEWALEQDDTPWLRFSTTGSAASDPGELTEAVGDENAIEATRLGVRNLERVMDLLLDATTENGENWDDLEELYGRILGQWVREMNHVGALVGGFHSRQLHGGQDGVRFTPVDAERQEQAVDFLNEFALNTPDFMVQEDILRLIEPSGVTSRVLNSQRSILNFLLDSNRFTRLMEQKAIDDSAYGPAELLESLRLGIWEELSDRSVSIDAFRRNVQRLYLDLASDRVAGDGAQWNDMRAFLRGELRMLDAEVTAALERADDDMTRYHLEDVRDQIATILDPEIHSARAAEGQDTALTPDPFNPYTIHPDWTDFLIEP